MEVTVPYSVVPSDSGGSETFEDVEDVPGQIITAEFRCGSLQTGPLSCSIHVPFIHSSLYVGWDGALKNAVAQYPPLKLDMI